MATTTGAPAPSTAAVDPTQRRFRGCAKLEEYEVTDKLGEGTFGVVSKGRSRRTGAIVALKKIIIHNEKDGFPITALREIKLLKMLSHVNILKLDEMAVERHKGDGKKRATLYMVTPYMDHDLSGMTTNPDIRFHESMIKCYMLQLLEGLRYLHDSHILHRDMKAANILINNRGILQIADFGLARHYEGMTPQPGRGNGDAVRDYTALVVTRWYRPPELLLSLRRYTPAIDMWGAGCVFAEMYERRPILEGKSDLSQAQIIFELVGSPNDQSMPGWQELPGCEGVNTWENQRGNISKRFAKMPPEGLSLLKELLRLDWRRRINAIDALQHPYFDTNPLPAQPENLPRFEPSHELDRRKHHEKRTAPPAAPAGGDIGMGPEESWNNGNYVNGYDSRGRPAGGGRDRGPPGGNRGETTTTSAVRRPRSGLPPPPASGLPPRPRSPNGLPRVLHRLMGAGLTLGMVEVHLGEAEEGMWTRIFRPTVMIEPVLTMAVDGEAETCRLLIDIVIGTLLVVAGMEGTGTGGPEAEVPIAIGGIRIEIGESVLRGYRIANATFIGVVNPDGPERRDSVMGEEKFEEGEELQGNDPSGPYHGGYGPDANPDSRNADEEA
ncbi:serine/threonine protein kinase, CMGC, CDC2/CDK sub [Taxawa tesnikishii (nom. ined.)]|nr:serine/threonine protein kinase, CMGC, CDC2/CDK sub [Dothideales sp. JES 119]